MSSADLPSLVVQVTNSEPSTERVQVALGGRTAVDVDLAGAEDCWGDHNPVFSLGYDLAAGPVEAALTLQGETTTSTIDVPRSGTIWAVVQVQSERAWGEITTYRSRPVRG